MVMLVWGYSRNCKNTTLWDVLSFMSLKENLLCESCAKGKHVKSSLKSKNDIFTKRPLELIHLNLFWPTKTKYVGGKR